MLLREHEEDEVKPILHNYMAVYIIYAEGDDWKTLAVQASDFLSGVAKIEDEIRQRTWKAIGPGKMDEIGIGVHFNVRSIVREQ